MRLIVILIFCCTVSLLQAQPTDVLKQKALILKRFLEKNHYQPLIWNDTTSIRLYNKWMESLDEEKLLFTKSDIALLQPFSTSIDQEMKGGNWQFFRKSTDLYRRRLLKVDSIIKNVLAKPLDFSLNENIQYPFTTFAVDDMELQQRWKKYCKLQVLRKIASDNDSVNLSPSAFATAEKEAVAFQKIHEQNYIERLLGDSPAEFETDLQESYLNSIAWCYDPHTTYMNTSVKDEFETRMSASEFSVGFEVEENEKGEPVVSFLQPGGSAWRTGQLHKGDVLVAIKVGKVFKNIADITATEMQAVFAGRDKTETEIKVRTVTGEMKTVKLAKEKISSEEEVVKSYVLQGRSNIGYINLPGFYSRENTEIKKMDDLNYDGSANDVSKEIVKLKKDSITGLILDLRYNGGGSIWEALQLAGIFIDIGPLASIKDKEGKVTFLKDPNRGTIYDGPLLVLINGASASASEFIGAVLQDYNRALIVGGTSYGKGTAQSILPMDSAVVNPNKQYEDFVKVTEQKFYRVNGGTTQWKGVEPDIALPDMYSSEAHKEKSEISALQPDMSKVGMFKPLPALPIAGLQTKSETRVAASPYFAAIKKYLDFTEKNETRTVALAWPAYLQQYRESKKLYNSLTEEGLRADEHLSVRNNSFDKARFTLSADDANDAYLENISTDPVIKEALNIMRDWTGNK